MAISQYAPQMFGIPMLPPDNANHIQSCTNIPNVQSCLATQLKIETKCEPRTNCRGFAEGRGFIGRVIVG